MRGTVDISSHFSFEDFLAYFFPGITGSVGIYLLLLLTPLHVPLSQLPTDIFAGTIYLVISYVVGVFLSGISEIVLTRLRRHKNNLPFQEDFNETILRAFQDVFDTSEMTNAEWSKEHFYICRSLIYECMPSASPALKRQSSLRQLRINLLPSLLIWCCSGVGWGIWHWVNNDIVEGISLIVVSVAICTSFLVITINRAQSNEWREVREVLTAFLAGYKTGAFDDRKCKQE
jgi:hypothetical protein